MKLDCGMDGLSRVLVKTVGLVVAVTLLAASVRAAEQDLYLETVRAYADALLEHGRDHYGEVSSPLIAVTLNRTTLSLFEGEALEELRNLKREQWGIRSHDRMLTGANPMHDQNLYQVLYALATLTGEQRYAEEADQTLKWFFEHCQSEGTGLMAWGEHIGWDFYTETIIEKDAGTTHEFFRPWTLWPRCFELAPKPCLRFALGLWDNQVQKSGNFSRHANYVKHGPGKNSEYPRHGGFYIDTWSNGYRQTENPQLMTAAETLVDYFEGRRHPESGALPAESAERSKGMMVWPPSNLSLAVDLWNGASFFPDEVGEKMRQCAAKSDAVYLRLNHDLGPGGKGFIKTADTVTLGAGDVRGQRYLAYSRLWATGYGDATDAVLGNLCMLRYRQIKDDGYKRLVLDSAVRYLNSEPDTSTPVYPGTLGHVILLMLAAHEVTGEEQYVERADHFADAALDLFWDDTSPLPKASSKHDHYEAITCADTLAMAILKLWAQHEGRGGEVQLVFNDR